MSSHRDYAKDKEWQYLRSSQGSDALSFEKQEDGTSELIVMPGWPHMVSTLIVRDDQPPKLTLIRPRRTAPMDLSQRRTCSPLTPRYQTLGSTTPEPTRS